MNQFSIATLIGSLFLSCNLFAAQAYFEPDMKDLSIGFLEGFSTDLPDKPAYDFPPPPVFFNNATNTPDDCRPVDTQPPAKLNLSTTPFSYDSPILAVNAYAPIKLIASEYLKEQFVVVEHYEQAYEYLVAPSGDYHWGDYVIELKGPSLPNSLTVTYVTLTVFITYIEGDDGYRATGFDLQQQTVH
ncbi:hypothetical protein A9Q89_09885 [Gammaproteobacteria bacterium 53_120_T64]|nr:hypothetical protein A9Q89_09885 [Gammaproteobacteria bacterium 53_120_T64]